MRVKDNESRVGDVFRQMLMGWYKGRDKEIVCVPRQPHAFPTEHSSCQFLPQRWLLRRGGDPKPRTNNELGAFLKANPFAKMIIVIDAHSDQEGLLIHFEDEDGYIYSDHLGPVRFGTLRMTIY